MRARPAPRILWIATIFLALIGVEIAVRRMAALVSPSSPRFGPAAGLDAHFDRHATLTMIHIIPGLLFMGLAPLQFVRRIRARKPRLHRWIGRIVVSVSMIVGGSALVMSPQMAIGGISETLATTIFALLFLFATIRGFVHIRRGEVRRHREWMIRAFAIGLAVATIRPIVGVFFATSRLTGLTSNEFFGPAFWIGFTLQTIAAEAWIRHTRSAGVAGKEGPVRWPDTPLDRAIIHDH